MRKLCCLLSRCTDIALCAVHSRYETSTSSFPRPSLAKRDQEQLSRKLAVLRIRGDLLPQTAYLHFTIKLKSIALPESGSFREACHCGKKERRYAGNAGFKIIFWSRPNLKNVWYFSLLPPKSEDKIKIFICSALLSFRLSHSRIYMSS